MEEIQSRFEVPRIMHFVSLFKDAFGFAEFDTEDFEESFVSGSPEGKELLLDLIFRLLNGCYGRQDIGPDNYEHYLNDIFRFRLEQEQAVENPLKNKTFFELTVHNQITVFDHLVHFRLDADDVASGHLKGLDGDCMRVEPLGVDAGGCKYWYFYGVRLYKEDARPMNIEEPKKKGRRSKKRKKVRKGKEKQSEEEEHWGEEALDYLTSKAGDCDEDQVETPAVKKAARLHVNLEKKDDVDDAGEDEMDLDLQDDVESLKFDSSDEDEEENFYEDHSSDEDYSEKGSKKQKNGKRKKNNGNKMPKAVKTPAAKKGAKVPEILRSTPKSARLRARFGYVDDNTANNISNDRQSRSHKSKNNSKGRKKARDVDETEEKIDVDSEKMDTDTVENESSLPENNNTEDTKGKKEARNNEIKQEEDALSQACIKDASVDSTAKEEAANMDVETAIEQAQKPVPVSVSSDNDDVEIIGNEKGYRNNQKSSAEKMETSTADHLDQEEAEIEKKSAPEPTQKPVSVCPSDDDVEIREEEKGDCSNQKNKGAALTEHGTDSIKQEIVEVSDDSTSDPSDNLDNSQSSIKEETSLPTTASIKQEMENTSQENAVSDETSSDDSCPRVDMKTEKAYCEDEKPDNNNKHPSLKPSKDSVKLTIRLPKMEREDTDSQDSKTSGSSKGEKVSKPWEPRQETLASKRTGWHLVCEVVQDWEHLVAVLEDSPNRNQRALVKVLRENFLPDLPAIQEERVS